MPLIRNRTLLLGCFATAKIVLQLILLIQRSKRTKVATCSKKYLKKDLLRLILLAKPQENLTL